mgnify:FL=1
MHLNGYKTGVNILLLVLLFTVLPLGCGKTFDSIPDGSTITLDPDSVSFSNISSDTIQNFTVTLRYPDGTPIPFAVIEVAGSFAIPNGMGLYQFYFYPNGTQTVGNIAVDSGFKAQTKEDGTYSFSVVFFAGSLFEEDTIRVTSGTVSGTATLANTAS